MKLLVVAAVVLLLSPGPVLCQNSAVGWSAFDMGFAIPSSTSQQVPSVVGQVIVGPTVSANAIIEIGLLGFLPVTSGYPSNTGTFVVTTAGDTGAGSLRWAIQSANATPGLNIITFNIPGGGVHTITPQSALPEIVDPVYIDGYSQPGSHPNTNGPGFGSNAVLLIELNGTHVNPSTGGVGLMIRDGNCTIRGLVINRTPNAAILTQYGSNNVFEGNFIGTDPTGNVAMGNVYGIVVETPGSNYRIGGTTPAARNVISGSTFEGVAFGIIAAGGSSHVVQGNLIGTNAAGTAALPNGTGIHLGYIASGLLIGGNTPAARNIISGNTAGIAVSSGVGSPLVSHNLIQGNFIGTDVTGSARLGNTQDGVDVDGTSNFVGGSTPGAGNLISGNGRYGISLFGGDSSLVQGNYIGTDATGTLPIGNHDGGILLTANDVMIGGTAPGAGNVIAFNGTSPAQHAGVALIGSSHRNAILGNSISSNAGLGIDLGGNQYLDGVTINDSCDVDTLGPNNYQNYPVLTYALPGIDKTIIGGTLNSRPGGVFRIEFFASPMADTTGYGEGKTFIGFTTIATGSSCSTSFVDTLPVILPFGAFVSATATDAFRNTSEFAKCIVFGSTSSVESGQKLPETFALSQNYPNPFNPTTVVRYQLPVVSDVKLIVYDILGREVAVLANERKSPGIHEVRFDASNLSSGVYFCRLQARAIDRRSHGDFTETRRLLLLK